MQIFLSFCFMVENYALESKGIFRRSTTGPGNLFAPDRSTLNEAYPGSRLSLLRYGFNCSGERPLGPAAFAPGVHRSFDMLSSGIRRLSFHGNNTLLVVFTVLLAVAIPKLGLFISLVGAVGSSFLALIFPPILEVLTYGADDQGKYRWRLYKNAAIFLFGVTGFITGTYVAIWEIVLSFTNEGVSGTDKLHNRTSGWLPKFD